VVKPKLVDQARLDRQGGAFDGVVGVVVTGRRKGLEKFDGVLFQRASGDAESEVGGFLFHRQSAGAVGSVGGEDAARESQGYEQESDGFLHFFLLRELSFVDDPCRAAMTTATQRLCY
jgi:hypothetical protein